VKWMDATPAELLTCRKPVMSTSSPSSMPSSSVSVSLVLGRKRPFTLCSPAGYRPAPRRRDAVFVGVDGSVFEVHGEFAHPRPRGGFVAAIGVPTFGQMRRPTCLPANSVTFGRGSTVFVRVRPRRFVSNSNRVTLRSCGTTSISTPAWDYDSAMWAVRVDRRISCCPALTDGSVRLWTRNRLRLVSSRT